MLGKKRSYRKNLTSYGLIYIGGEELELTVKNISITGLLAHLHGRDAIYGIKEIFRAIEKSALVDIYLPEMRVAGEAEITRADANGEKVYLALEYRNLSFEINNVLYRRKAYRKQISAPGKIVFHEKKYDFFTKNVSVGGMTIMINETILASQGTVTIFDFKRFNLRGQVRVAWVEYADDNFTFMGIQFLNLQNNDIEGIPRFDVEYPSSDSYW